MLYGAFVWTRRALNSPKRRFPARAGADLNGRDRLGHTALHLAARYGHEEVVAMLLERGVHPDHGPDVDPLSFTGQTPLHLAAADGQHLVAELLCQMGCLLDPADRDDKTPAAMAEKGGYADVVAAIEAERGRRAATFVVGPEREAVVELRAELQGLQGRVVSLEASAATKDEEVQRLVKNSQQYVAESQAVADRLTEAETAEELDALEEESNKYVELAEDCARELAMARAEAAGLQAELTRTDADARRRSEELLAAEAERTLHKQVGARRGLRPSSPRSTEAHRAGTER